MSRKKTTPPASWPFTGGVIVFGLIYLGFLWFLKEPGFEPLLALLPIIGIVIVIFGVRNSECQNRFDQMVAIVLLIFVTMAGIFLYFSKTTEAQLTKTDELIELLVSERGTRIALEQTQATLQAEIAAGKVESIATATVIAQEIIDSETKIRDIVSTRPSLVETVFPSTTPTLPTLTPSGTPIIAEEPNIVDPIFPLSNKVLWDISHYQDTENVVPLYQHEKYSSLKVLLSSRNMENVISAENFLDYDLSEFGIIIINLAWGWEKPYTEDEANKILDYVSRGGNLVIMADHKGNPNHNLQIIADKFDVILGGDYSIGTNVDGIEHLTIFSDHVIFDGISDIILDYWSGELLLSDDENVVALGKNANGQIGIAALEFGEGKVIVLGDLAIWHDTEIVSSINDGQNHQFVSNTLDWMLEGN